MRKGHLAGLTFSVVFGLTFMFSKTALAHAEPIGLIAYRFLLAFLVFETLRRLGIIRVRFARAHVKALAVVALFQPVLYFLFETYGLDRTTSGEAGMMIALIPIVVSILSTWILKEKPTRLQILFILLSVSGVIVIQLAGVIGDFDVDALGFALLFGAVVSAAAFNIASRHASTSLTPFELTYFMMFAGAVVFNIIYLFTLFIQGSKASYIDVFARVQVAVPVLYLGIVASFGGFFLLNYALARLQAHVISIYANLSTVIAIIAGAIFLNETVHRYHVLGATMIITGVYGTIRANRRARKYIG